MKRELPQADEALAVAFFRAVIRYGLHHDTVRIIAQKHARKLTETLFL